MDEVDQVLRSRYLGWKRWRRKGENGILRKGIIRAGKALDKVDRPLRSRRSGWKLWRRKGESGILRERSLWGCSDTDGSPWSCPKVRVGAFQGKRRRMELPRSGLGGIWLFPKSFFRAHHRHQSHTPRVRNSPARPGGGGKGGMGGSGADL